MTQAISPNLLIYNGLKTQSLKERLVPVATRKKRLTALKTWILRNRQDIHREMALDFGKNPSEIDGVEIFHVLSEISHTLRHLDQWTKPRKAEAPLTMLGSRSQILYEPKGVCLIISPWNYPFALTIGPLIAALSAGNTVLLKPSEITPHASALIQRLVKEVFEPDIVSVIEGGVETTTRLLELPFDHIFFTGSPAIGKIVMTAAAKNLTSVTLELGGKSPCIVSSTARLTEAADRIAVAKFVNNGQTCVAPDYLFVHQAIADKFLPLLMKQITRRFDAEGLGFGKSPDYCRISSAKHFTRVHNMIQDALEKGNTLLMEGEVREAERFIGPTVVKITHPDCALMKEEIFGPVLPVVIYESLDEVVQYINDQPKPLGLYLFSTSSQEQLLVRQATSAGGMCINECAIQFLHSNLPFGGVNTSGIGKSHGYEGFLGFSNQKPVLKQFPYRSTVELFYPPYRSMGKRLFEVLLRFI